LISSGDNNHLSEREMNQLGINGFLMKPFLKKDLSESIQQALSVSDK
jgi:FixJ family two-component response regulator